MIRVCVRNNNLILYNNKISSGDCHMYAVKGHIRLLVSS